MLKELPLILVTLVTAASLAGCGSAAGEPADENSGGSGSTGDTSSGSGAGGGSTSSATGSGGDGGTSCGSCSGGGGTSCGSCSGGGGTSCGSCSTSCSTCAAGCGCVDTTNDPENCGFCGHDCDGEACIEGLCQPKLLASPTQSRDLIVDDSYVYYSDYIDGHVLKVPISGGTSQVIASGQVAPSKLAIDQTHLYWTNNGLSPTGSIQRWPLSGGSPSALASSLNIPWDLAVGAAHAYFDIPGGIARVPVGGGTPQTVTSGHTMLGSIVVNGTHVYWATGGGGGDGTIMRRELTGGSGDEVLATNLTDPMALCLGGQNLYFAEGGGLSNDVYKLPLGGGTPEVIASVPERIYALTKDSTHVYWGTSYGGVYRTPLQGGEKQQMGDVDGIIYGIAVDGTSIYTARFQAIEKLPK